MQPQRENPGPARSHTGLGRRGTAALLALWGLLVVAGLAGLMGYATTEGARGATPARWPTDSALPRDPAGPTVLVFMHPQCPCSRATLAELEEILREAGGSRPEVLVVFAAPCDVGPGFVEGELARRVRALPGARLWVDLAEVEARRFGAETSGHVLVYGRDGALVFSGGITPTRGHIGPNAGARAVLAALTNVRGATLSEVFGCPLEGSRSEAP